MDEKSGILVDKETLEKVKTRSAEVLGVVPSKMENRWYVPFEICAGEEALVRPTIILTSDCLLYTSDAADE